MGTFFLSSILVGEPSPKKGKRALLGHLDFPDLQKHRAQLQPKLPQSL